MSIALHSVPYIHILTQYRERLLRDFPDELQRLILFGSQARGEAHFESDLDVLVVVSWEEEKLPDGHFSHPYHDHRWQKIVELAHDISLDYGVILAPIVMSETRFQAWSPLTNTIKREGLEIWKKPELKPLLPG